MSLGRDNSAKCSCVVGPMDDETAILGSVSCGNCGFHDCPWGWTARLTCDSLGEAAGPGVCWTTFDDDGLKHSNIFEMLAHYKL